jgi:hypothetical protein
MNLSEELAVMVRDKSGMEAEAALLAKKIESMQENINGIKCHHDYKVRHFFLRFASLLNSSFSHPKA